MFSEKEIGFEIGSKLMPASIQAAPIEPRQNSSELENEATFKNGDSKSEKNEENLKEEIQESENSSEISQKERFA